MTQDVRRRLPNLITLMRLVLAAAFFATLNMYRYPHEHREWANIALVLFIAAAISDALDGYLARKWKVTSAFGQLMDPFCDKVLVLGAFIYLAGPRFVVPEWIEQDNYFTMASGVYPWMVAIMLARELLVTGIRGFAESLGADFATRVSGKLKMIFQSICIPIVLFLVVNFHPSQMPWSRWTCTVLIYATVLVTIWSGVPYLVDLRALMRRQRAGST